MLGSNFQSSAHCRCRNMKILTKSLFLCFLLFEAFQADVFTNEEIEMTFITELNKTRIRENLEFLTKHPHVSGSVYNNRLGESIAKLWSNFGFDSVEKVVYEVLLSFPDPKNPNKIQLLGDNNEILFTSKYIESVLRIEDKHDDLLMMFNAFSPNGTVEGELVYANYATPEDFEELNDMGINVNGKIIIARYGKIFRGNKVDLAVQYGAIGMIFFNDPFEYAQEGDLVYPLNHWLPGSGAQRGSILTGSAGDFQTPNYPSIANVYRWPVDELEYMKKIPCQPIGYQDAIQLMKSLGGFKVPTNWSGHAFTKFNIGPGFLNNVRKLRLNVNNQLQLTNITNVIGIIRGTIEPDRYVIAGNHRDAWGFGAADASSGTAQMIEVTRVFGKLIYRGWRPRRTLVFCSWDAEEFSITGSYEWVQDKLLKLTKNAVAYVNTDTCVSGDKFSPNASPHLARLLTEIAKKVPSPFNESGSLYDNWLDDSIRYNEINKNGEIKVKALGGGTDHVPFFAYAGIPSVDISFQVDQMKFERPFNSYAVYHTNYDTFFLVDSFIDPDYRKMQACGHMNLFLLNQLSHAEILPFNMSDYVQSISEAFTALETDGILNILKAHKINVDILNRSVRNFIKAAKEWEIQNSNLSTTDLFKLRAFNDQLMMLDKAFLKYEGVPMQAQYRHLIFALSLHNMYGGNTFPGIRDLVYEITHNSVSNEVRQQQLHRHISDVIVAFHTATEILQPVHLI